MEVSWSEPLLCPMHLAPSSGEKSDFILFFILQNVFSVVTLENLSNINVYRNIYFTNC